MSKFEKGDRVRVEFEGRFQSEPVIGTYAILTDDDEKVWVRASSITKLHDPLPTKAGAVIRTDSGSVFERGLANVWWETGNSSNFISERIQNLANEYGFTVLYAGDDE